MHQDVDVTEAGDRVMDDARHRRSVEEIGDGGRDAVGAVSGGDAVDGGGEAVGVDVGHHHAGPGVGQRDRRRPADVARRAGDHRDAPGEHRIAQKTAHVPKLRCTCSPMWCDGPMPRSERDEAVDPAE